MLCPRIRKEDRVHRDTVLVQPNQKGSAVGASPKGVFLVGVGGSVKDFAQIGLQILD